MASSNLDEIVACHINNMNDFDVLLSDAFQNQIVSLWLFKID